MNFVHQKTEFWKMIRSFQVEKTNINVPHRIMNCTYLKYMDAMGTPAPMPTPVMALAVYNSSKVLACHVKSQPTVKGRQSSKTAILRPNLDNIF